MFKDFRAFIMRGNVIDMAVGVIIGAAFGKIVASLVADVIMPPIGLMLGGMDMSQLAIVLRPAQGETPAVAISYGKFLNTIIDFLIVAFAVFMGVRTVGNLSQRWQKEETPAEPTTKECPHCLMTVPVNAKRCGHCTSLIDNR